MRISNSLVTNWLTLIASILVVLGVASAAEAQPQPQFNAFSDRAIDAAAERDHREVVRSRFVSVDLANLKKLKDGDAFTLNLFNDVALLAVCDDVYTSDASTVHWRGHIHNNPRSSVIIVSRNDAVAGLVRAPSQGDFRIRSSRNHGQVVEELDSMLYAPCGTGPAQAINAAAMKDAAHHGPVGVECAQYIDVMIVYTPQARDLEGGTDAIEALGMVAIDETNSTYVNSQISARVRLVHIGEVDYEESGDFGIELDRLQNPNDGFMDDVHALRQQYGADLVDLLISHTQGETICGIGYLMTTVSTDFSEWGFSVCNTGCTAGGYTLEHELGHNMGCHHDRQNAGGPGAFPYSFGYRFVGDDTQLYRTIMSYAPGNRIPYFSNPNINYQGQPTGLPDGHTDRDGQPDSADNARTINETESTVKQFMPSTSDSALGGQIAHQWTSPQLIQPAELLAGDRFGTSIAINGELMIIGAYTQDRFFADYGSAYVYRRNAATSAWEFVAKLTPNSGAGNDRFGVSVAIYGQEGSSAWAAIGAYLADDGGRDSGAVYIFREGSSGWTQEAKLIANDPGPGDLFGRSVSLAVTDFGEMVLIGAYLDDDNAANSGSAYIFRHAGPFWVQDAKLHAGDPHANDQFGFGVALGSSPATKDAYALVSAWRTDDGAADTGSAYLFHYDGFTWVQIAKLTPQRQAANDQFGYCVALDVEHEPHRAIVGAWMVDGAGANTGAAYVFQDTGKSWAEEAMLTPSDPAANDRFGSSVGISDGAAIVGSYLADPGGVLNAGAAYIFRQSGLGWVQETKVVAPDAHEEDQFAFAAAIDGDHAAVSAWQHPLGKNTLAGAVYAIDAAPLADCNQNGVPDVCDIVLGTSADVNANGIPDECEMPHCLADIAPQPAGDNVVNVSDLLAIINAWGACPAPPTTCRADIAPPGGDGLVNVSDLLAIINAWGPCP